MPFVFHGRQLPGIRFDRLKPNESLTFSRPNHYWRSPNADEKSDLFNNLSEIREVISSKSKQEFSGNWLEVARKAIKSMLEAGFYHEDLRWRHVGLLPKFSTNFEFEEFQPILIDLSDIRELKDEERKSFESNSDEFVHKCMNTILRRLENDDSSF